MDINLKYLEICKKLFEEKVSHLVSKPYKRKDLLFLADEIYEKTNILLSLSTLVRLWSESYKSVPQIKTLDALCIYMGYKNWYDFKSQQKDPDLRSFRQEVSQRKRFNIKKNKITIYTGGFIMLGLAFLIISISRNARYNNEDIAFRLDTIQSTGIPATVKFYLNIPVKKNQDFMLYTDNYNKSNIKVDGSVKSISTTYIFPGIFRPKLYYNDKIIKESPILITTDNWQCIITYERKKFRPIIVNNKDIYDSGYLHITPEMLDKYHVRVFENLHEINYVKVGNVGPIENNNFIFETRIKNSIDYGARPCQGVYIYILCENGDFQIPFCQPGYISSKKAIIGDIELKGVTTDLSAFGCNMSEFQNIRIVNSNQKLSTFRNNKFLKSFPYDKPLGKIVGFKFKFLGCGTVEYVRLLDENEKPVLDNTFKL